MAHRSFSAFAAVVVLSTAAAAQPEIGLGADVVSRYVWRGYDFGQSASIQPSLSVTSGGFEGGAWGSYALTSAGANELDLYASYTAGVLTVGVTDYYFPSAPPDLGVTSGSDYFNFDDGGNGAHYIEPFVGVSVGDLSFTLATVVYNDPTFSTYVEAAYGFEVSGTSLGIALGSVVALDPVAGSPGSAFYGTSKDATVTNIALSASRDVPITSSFTLPVFGSYVINPETERAFLLFGFSL